MTIHRRTAIVLLTTAFIISAAPARPENARTADMTGCVSSKNFIKNHVNALKRIGDDSYKLTFEGNSSVELLLTNRGDHYWLELRSPLVSISGEFEYILEIEPDQVETSAIIGKMASMFFISREYSLKMDFEFTNASEKLPVKLRFVSATIGDQKCSKGRK